MAGRELTVCFSSWAELAAQKGHLQRAGLFLPLPSPAPEPLAELEVALVAPDGSTVTVAGRVVQIAPGVGMALMLRDASASARLGPLLERASREPADAAAARAVSQWGLPSAAVGSPKTFELGAADAAVEGDELGMGAPLDPAATSTLHDQIRAMSTSEKMRLAMHGERAARLLLLKDPNKTIQLWVIQNKRITIDEVLHLAGFRQANPEVLARIAENRDWTQNPSIVAALVANPKTPPTTAVRLLRLLGPAELRRIAKSQAVTRVVQQAARKLVSG